jgi:cystathionine gamma-lyase
MIDPRETRPGTRVIHAGQRPEPITGAVMPPIFLSSTYAQDSPGVHKGYEYTRSHNPTRYALERMVALLEGSTIEEETDASRGGFAFASGMAATSLILDLLDQGARVVTGDDLYGGTHRLFKKVRERSQGLQVVPIDLTDEQRFSDAMTSDTAMVWLETPTNPMLKIADLEAIVRIAKEKNPDVLVVCDNTFATPINQRPLDLGCDIVMHSATKYLNGHSDCVAGLLVTSNPELAERIRFIHNSAGPILSPFDSYLVLRGIKTLDVRMERHNASAMRIAQWLETRDDIDRVVYPGLPSHPQHEIAKKQMTGFGGMITIFVAGGIDHSRTMLERVRIFALAESLGGVESLIEHPAIMTHASVPPEQRAALGISDSLVRLSIGIEDPEDLIADLEQSLA